jgi:membrane-associated HD superfamily phosphohydrolase
MNELVYENNMDTNKGLIHHATNTILKQTKKCVSKLKADILNTYTAGHLKSCISLFVTVNVFIMFLIILIFSVYSSASNR